MEIIWKPTFITAYSISNTGILRNKRGVHIKPTSNSMIYLHDKNKSYYMPIWVLVANAFIPPTSRVLEHIDGDPSNNCVNNLQYI